MALFKPFGYYRQVVAGAPAPPVDYSYLRYDPYYNNIQLAIPGTDFANPSGFTMANWYNEIHADIKGSGTNYTANPTGSASEFVEYTTSTKWADYDSSMYVKDAGSWGGITTSNFGIGNSSFVVEGWLYMDERFTKPPYWKVGLRDSSYNIEVAMGFPASGTTDWKSRIMINGNQYFSSNQNIAFNLNQWYHVAWVRTSGTLYTYINGTRYSNGTSTASVTTGGTTRIMTGENATNDGTAGAWQDFRFYVGTDKGYNTTTISTPLSIVTDTAQDSDANAFFSAAGITNDTQIKAVNDLVTDLKTAGIWSKMIAIYPFVGGTADKHKFNLKNPANTDAAYRITWAGTVTHNSNGFQGNGTTGVGYTHIPIDTALSQNNVSAAMYIRTAAGGGTDYGAISGGAGMQLNSRYTDNLNYNKLMHGGAHYTQASTDGSGFWQQSRTSSSSYYVQQNTTRNTASVASSTPPSGEYIALAAIGTSETTAIGFSAKQYAFAAFGSGLSTTEMDDFNTAVQKFQTTLGRNV